MTKICLGMSKIVTVKYDEIWFFAKKYHNLRSQKLQIFFMSPAWKVRRGHPVIVLSVCLFVRISVPPRFTYTVQLLKSGWWYSDNLDCYM